jgi:hypothetical protein
VTAPCIDWCFVNSAGTACPPPAAALAATSTTTLRHLSPYPEAPRGHAAAAHHTGCRAEDPQPGCAMCPSMPPLCGPRPNRSPHRATAAKEGGPPVTRSTAHPVRMALAPPAHTSLGATHAAPLHWPSDAARHPDPHALLPYRRQQPPASIATVCPWASSCYHAPQQGTGRRWGKWAWSNLGPT